MCKDKDQTKSTRKPILPQKGIYTSLEAEMPKFKMRKIQEIYKHQGKYIVVLECGHTVERAYIRKGQKTCRCGWCGHRAQTIENLLFHYIGYANKHMRNHLNLGKPLEFPLRKDQENE